MCKKMDHKKILLPPKQGDYTTQGLIFKMEEKTKANAGSF